MTPNNAAAYKNRAHLEIMGACPEIIGIHLNTENAGEIIDYLSMGNIGKIIHDLSKAIELKSDYAQAYYWRGHEMYNFCFLSEGRCGL